MNNLSPKQLEAVATTIRVLSAEAVEAAQSGHPGMPLGTADIAAVLWLRFLRFNASNPKWINRDRFVLSNGHGSMLLYSILHLAGYDISLEDIKRFRQLDSITPGHPEFGHTPGVEATTGPLGQGIANAVGMAIGAKCLQHSYNTEQHEILNHNIWCMVGDGCLMEGISGEASSLAGHLGLGNLKVIYDDNRISIAGSTNLSFSEDVLKRYQAYGWHVIAIDGHDYDEICRGISEAIAVTDRPTLIAAKTIIGKGSPNKANSAESHGAPLGKNELAATLEALGWVNEPFFVPPEVAEMFAARNRELAEAFQEWNTQFNSWQEINPEQAAKLEEQLSLAPPPDLEQALLESVSTFSTAKKIASRKQASLVLQTAAIHSPSLIGGSADLEPSTLTVIKSSSSINRHSFSGRNIHFGVREHAMAAIMNGLALHGGFIPFGSTFLVFVDYMKPAIRMAALSKLRVLFIFTHDSLFVGEDGPTHQPIEHLASLRIIPNLWVFRPANSTEISLSYSIALEREDGPVAMILTRQDFDQAPCQFSTSANIRKGAYIVYSTQNPDSSSKLVFVATGSEVGLAIRAAKFFENTHAVQVVSMPCCELYKKQDHSYQQQIIPQDAFTVVVEAGSTFGWMNIVGTSPDRTLLIGIDKFGSSAPAQVLAEHYHLTEKSIIERTSAFLANR